MKTLLIDGNNLIHKIPAVKSLFLKDKNASQLALLEAVKSKISRTDKLIIVFDGHGSFKKAEVIHSDNFPSYKVTYLCNDHQVMCLHHPVQFQIDQ